MTVFDEKKRPLLRMMTGGLLGVAGFLLLGAVAGRVMEERLSRRPGR